MPWFRALEIHSKQGGLRKCCGWHMDNISHGRAAVKGAHYAVAGEPFSQQLAVGELLPLKIKPEMGLADCIWVWVNIESPGIGPHFGVTKYFDPQPYRRGFCGSIRGFFLHLSSQQVALGSRTRTSWLFSGRLLGFPFRQKIGR